MDNLLPGAYTITITDVNGCTTTVTATVTNDLCCLTATATPTDAICGAEGSILVATASGTAPYTITYTGGAPITTAGPNFTITGLVAGSYVVTVVDAAGCEVTTTVTIGGISITATAIGSTVDCVSGFGTINASATGVGPYNVVILSLIHI